MRFRTMTTVMLASMALCGAALAEVATPDAQPETITKRGQGRSARRDPASSPRIQAAFDAINATEEQKAAIIDLYQEFRRAQRELMREAMPPQGQGRGNGPRGQRGRGGPPDEAGEFGPGAGQGRGKGQGKGKGRGLLGGPDVPPDVEPQRSPREGRGRGARPDLPPEVMDEMRALHEAFTANVSTLLNADQQDAWREVADDMRMMPRGGPRGRGDGIDRARLMRDFDTDGDGKLSEDERQAARDAMEQRRNERHDRMLDRFDTDGDGQLSETEREAMRQTLHDEMLKKFDEDGDGRLDRDERAKARADRRPPSAETESDDD